MEGFEGEALGHLYEFMKVEEKYRLDNYWIKSPDFLVFSVRDGVNGKIIIEYTAKEPIKKEIFEIYFIHNYFDSSKSEYDYCGKTIIKEITKGETE